MKTFDGFEISDEDLDLISNEIHHFVINRVGSTASPETQRMCVIIGYNRVRKLIQQWNPETPVTMDDVNDAFQEWVSHVISYCPQTEWAPVMVHGVYKSGPELYARQWDKAKKLNAEYCRLRDLYHQQQSTKRKDESDEQE